jgi:hypothetical protein
LVVKTPFGAGHDGAGSRTLEFSRHDADSLGRIATPSWACEESAVSGPVRLDPLGTVLVICGVSNHKLQGTSNGQLQISPTRFGRLLGSWVLGVSWSLGFGAWEWTPEQSVSAIELLN